MEDAGKDIDDATCEALLAILEQQRQVSAEITELDSSNGTKRIRSITIDGRMRPITLVAEALSAVLAWNVDADHGDMMSELRRCLDGLLTLRERLPREAARQFNTLDEFVQVRVLMLVSDSHALASARTQLLEYLLALGRELMDALLPPPAPEVTVIPTRKYCWKTPPDPAT